MSLLSVLIQCSKKDKKSSVNQSNQTQQIISQNFSCMLGNSNFNTSDMNCAPLITQGIDSLLMLNAYSQTDSISFGFTLKVNGLGNFSHDSSTVSTINRFVLNYGSPGINLVTYISKSGTINVTKYDRPNNIYAGTFSAIMTLSSNPSSTLAISNGTFYAQP